MAKKSDKGSYAPKQGGHGKGHKLGGVQYEKSLGAIRQEHGLPYEPAPPRGFRPGDAGKRVLDPNNRSGGPIDDMTPER
jgi:hypothetical protein